MKTKIIIEYQSNTVRRPVLSQAIKQHNVELNILKANINAQMNGRIFAEIEGSSVEISKFMDFMSSQSVFTDIRQSLLEINFEACTACDCCSKVCPTQALSLSLQDNAASVKSFQKLNFDPYKCVSCDRCIPACPVTAISEI